MAFIEAHASLPITASDVARADGAGPRALQLAFHRHLDTTPMTYLRRVRLAGAHRERVAADASAGDTGAAIAHRWGFASRDRSETAHRHEHGVLPSRTLRTWAAPAWRASWVVSPGDR